MNAADSSVAGYLQPTASSVYGEDLEDVFSRTLQGITGLAGNLIRPKNQENPPTHPGFDVNWCSFTIYVEPTLWNAYKTIRNDLAYTVEGTETLLLTTSFYGPDYQDVERRWRDGMQLAQNRDDLTAAGIQFVEFSTPVTVPLLLKERWVRHVDIRGTFQRWAVREYKVRSILSAQGDIHSRDKPTAGEIIGTFQTDPPPP